MLLLLLACRTQDVEIFIANEDEEALSRFVELLVDDRVHLTISESPHKSAQRARGQGVSITTDNTLASEAFRLSYDGAWRVESSDLLGRQYGLAELLEQAGYRFNHPYRTLLPEQLLLPQSVPNEGEIQAPEMTRRGIHLHTLHPIEGYYDVWEPSSESAHRAHQITDWLIKNKGNYLQWVALDDITENAIKLERWQEHNQQILAEMKLRGIQTGIGVQLHGSGNLQQAFDLIDEPTGDAGQQVQERLEMIMSGGEFDLVELSFGEFFGEDPQLFIDQINLAAETMWRERPELELAARLHVGADLTVTYEDRELIYYFLATYADPAIVPWVHTVMYYNLFDPTNGAYHHTEFDAHREFLVDRLRAEQPVVYFPESAYWVAFDNSVPTYLPLYIHL